MDNIPILVQQILADKELSMDQKMVGFMMFMKVLPDDPKVQKYVDTNLELGTKIKRLVDENKITIKMGKNFTLDVQVH